MLGQGGIYRGAVEDATGSSVMSEWAIDTHEAALLEAADIAVSIIREKSQNILTKETKVGPGGRQDFCTSLDREVQGAIIDYFRDRYPDHGYLHEETDATIVPWDGIGPYITIDPIDGTRALIDNEPHRICTMLSMVGEDGKALAACIKHVSGETYSFGPGSPHVFYTTEGHRRPLDASPRDRGEPILLRRPLEVYRPVTQKLAEKIDLYHASMECLGHWMPRLWQREFCACALWYDSANTPWDITPILAISQRLGYVFLRSTRNGKWFERFDPALPTRATIRGYDLVIIHENDLSLVEHLLRR